MEKDIRLRLLEETMLAFNEKGAKFTLDDLCRPLGISKKTIYQYFSSKEVLLKAMINEGFKKVKEEENKIFDSQDMDLIEKIKKIIIVIPEPYEKLNFKQFKSLKDYYPQVYLEIEEHLENEWDKTLDLLGEAINQGLMRQVSLPLIKTIIESSIESFLLGRYPEEMSYIEALEEMMEILIEGLRKKEGYHDAAN